MQRLCQRPVRVDCADPGHTASRGASRRFASHPDFATDAPVLVADEPTTALDLVTQRRVLAVLARERSTLVLITHDVAVAAELCTRALVIDEGRLVDDLPMADLLAGAGSPAARALVDDVSGASA